MTTAKQRRTVEKQVEQAVAQGAKIVAQAQLQPNLQGEFYPATLMTHVDHSMSLMIEETFGPVLPVMPFRTEEEAIAHANNTPFGLAAYFYTENSARTFRVGRALEYGMVGINVGVFSNEVGPFGGVKQSGLGREGSVWGIEEFLEMKYLCIGTN